MVDPDGWQEIIDAALAGLNHWQQPLKGATSVLSTTQWVITASLLVLAIIIGIWVGKDTEVMDESQDLNSINDQKEEVSKNELEQLRKQLQERDSELKDAKEESEQTLLQLHQVQEELEQLVLESKDTPKQEIERLQQQLDTRNSELKDAKEESEQTLLQLHQVQEELEQLVLGSKDVPKQRVEQLQQQLETRNNEFKQLEQQLETSKSECKEAREEAELTLLQLHQVQEELEHYFLESRELQKKMDSVNTISPLQQEQLQRIKFKLLKLFLAMPQMEKVNQAQIAKIPQMNQLLLRQQKSLRRFEALNSKP